MKQLAAFNRSKHGVRLWLAAMFLVMLGLNCMTPWVADDWVYMLNLVTKELLHGVGDIVESMAIHATNVNGRLLAHGLVQLTLLFPRLLFDIVNSAMYCLLMFLCYRLCRRDREENLLLMAAVSMGFFVFLPAFGQICLWQVGSVNYLWAMVLGIGFLLPYVRCFINKKTSTWNIAGRVFFSILGLALGLYTEIMSFVCLLLATAMTAFGGKTLRRSWMWIPVVTGAAGYSILLSMPAEQSHKAGKLTLDALTANLGRASTMLRSHLLLPLIIWAVLFAFYLYREGMNRRAGASLLLTLGGIVGNYMLIAATYYPLRCMYCSALLVVLAVGILLEPGEGAVSVPILPAVTLAVSVVFILNLAGGAAGIYSTWRQYQKREQKILSAVSQGQQELTLQIIKTDNPYSAFWDIRDLAEGKSDTWPNTSMAKVYGVDSITGVS